MYNVAIGERFAFRFAVASPPLACVPCDYQGATITWDDSVLLAVDPPIDPGDTVPKSLKEILFYGAHSGTTTVEIKPLPYAGHGGQSSLQTVYVGDARLWTPYPTATPSPTPTPDPWDAIDRMLDHTNYDDAGDLNGDGVCDAADLQ